jgi:energy-coupling factor transporter ATP-binding protein EcfA2
VPRLVRGIGEGEILRLILGLRDQLSLSALIVSHDLGVAWNIADRVAVMYLGDLGDLGDLGVPVPVRANLGRGGYFQAFPIGVAAELDADPKTLRLLDPPLVPAMSAAGREPRQ